MWAYERDILHCGGFLRFVLPDQSDVGRGRSELRGRSGNYARGTLPKILFYKKMVVEIKTNYENKT